MTIMAHSTTYGTIQRAGYINTSIASSAAQTLHSSTSPSGRSSSSSSLATKSCSTISALPPSSHPTSPNSPLLHTARHPQARLLDLVLLADRAATRSPRTGVVMEVTVVQQRLLRLHGGYWRSPKTIFQMGRVSQPARRVRGVKSNLAPYDLVMMSSGRAYAMPYEGRRLGKSNCLV